MKRHDALLSDPPFDAGHMTLADGRRVLVREGRPDDAAAVLSFVHGSLPDNAPYLGMDVGEFTMTAEDERKWFETQRATPGALTVLAFEGGRVVAMLNCSCRSERRRDAHIGHLGMSAEKAYWGSGLGGVMMGRLIDWAQRHPVLELLELDVFADNERALALYRGVGFVKAGVVPGRGRFADGKRKDGVIMYRRVDGTLGDSPGPGDLCEDLGDGVTLRQIRYHDAQQVYELYIRNRERMRPLFRWPMTVKSVGDVRGAIARWLERLADERRATCVLEQGGAVLGLVFMNRHDQTDRKAELGYWLDDGQEGKGLVTRGCRVLIRYLFEQLQVNRIEIATDVTNAGSIAVAERLGFTREAVIRQWLRFPDGRYVDMASYRLLREDWQPEVGR